MAPTRKGKSTDGLLARVNFPLYAVEMLTSRHLLVAGGGGSAKTGVANGFEIYEIYHDGSKFVAEEIVRHETGPTVVMNCAVKNNERRSLLVAGQESHCQLYLVNTKLLQNGEIQGKVTKEKELDDQNQNSNNVRQRKNLSKEAPSSDDSKNIDNTSPISNVKHIKFEIKPSDSIQTDFSPNEPLQRVVRISSNGRVMATGGLDGHLRLWQFPRMIKIVDINAHSREIDDIDFSPDDKYVLSIAKDGLGILWSVNGGTEVRKLTWKTPDGIKYLFKRCRFGTIEGKKDKNRLFTIANPLGKAGKQKGYLQEWNIETGQLNNAVGIDESLSALAVRDDGRFVAVGGMFSGSISIYIAFSLQRVLHIPGAHSMFVTGLEFLPVLNAEGPPISTTSEAAVLSISVDNRICIHSLEYRHALPAWAAIILIVVILFLTFVFCSYIGI